MISQVLAEIDNNAENYALFANRWNKDLKPLLEFKRYLETRNKDMKVEELSEKAVINKEIPNGNSKNSAANKKKTS